MKKPRIALLVAFAMLAVCGYGRAQTTTTVADTLRGPQGTTLSGRITISNNATFTAADGTVVPKGTVAVVQVANGAFSAALVPNVGSTPSGSSYTATYALTGGVFLTETWVVPASGPVTLADVRTSPTPSSSAVLSASQLPALTGDVNSSAGSAATKVVELHWGSTGLTLPSTPPGDGQCLTRSGLTITGADCRTFASLSGQATAAQLPATINSSALQDKGGQVFNVKAYGAKVDGRFVSDAVVTAGSATLTSATAAFTSADAGKVATVQMGAKGVGDLVYVSGATVTGTTGQTCTVGSFNGGGSGAAATVKLTGTNAIAASTVLIESAPGTGYTSAATSATLSDGTATCSGTITITSKLVTFPVTTTIASVTNATTVTLGTTATTSTTGAVAEFVTDDTAAWDDALTALIAAGGGIIYVPAGVTYATHQLAIPNDGLAGTSANQKSVRITGAGAQYNAYTTGQIGTGWRYPTGGSTVDLRYASGAKIYNVASGNLEIDHLNLVDYGLDAQTFISVVTNATRVYIHDNLFEGAWTKLGRLGNPDQTAFEGVTISGAIERNTFDRMKTGVHLTGATSNQMAVRDNYWTWSWGPGPGILLDGGAFRNEIENNNFEMNYVTTAPIQLVTSGAATSSNTIAWNSFPDVTQTPYTTSTYISTDAGSYGNVIEGIDPSNLSDGGSNNFVTICTAPTGLCGRTYTINGTGNLNFGTYTSGTYITSDVSKDLKFYANGHAMGFVDQADGKLYLYTFLRNSPHAFSTLPTCSASYAGQQAYVTDSTTATWGATIAGSGTNKVFAWCNGTNWTVMGQ